MRYLVTIIAIIMAASVFSSYFFLTDKKMPPDKVVLSINGHDFDKESISEQSTRYGYHIEEIDDVYKTLITRELLIQEARRRNIDQEENFREALKKYYENSLISILLERRNDEIAVHVTDDEIAKYQALCGKSVTFTRLGEIPKAGSDVTKLPGTTTTALFDDLATTIQQLLWSIKVGEVGIKFDTGNGELAIRLDAVSVSTQVGVALPDATKVRDILLEFKKERELNRWLAELKKKATIKIHNDQ